MNDVAVLSGRILLAAIFLWSGYGTASGVSELAKYLGTLGIPLPLVAAPLVLAWESLGGLGVLLGLFTRTSALALAAFCLVTAVMVHYHPEKMNDMIQFMKNLAMAGGCLFLAAYGGGRWSVDRQLSAKWPKKWAQATPSSKA